MDIGKRIIKLRESREWSQRELAKRVNINVSVMNRIESGERAIRDHELVALANALEVSTDKLLGREEKMTSDLEEFEAWVNDPKVDKFYREFNESPDERKEALLAVWEILKKQGK